MNIFWIDPVNTDPQFINLLGIVLCEAGHNVTVCSNARDIILPPPEINWLPFSTIRRLPTSLENHRLMRLLFGMFYPSDWFRAILLMRKFKIKKTLISTNLALPMVDTWMLRLMNRYNIKPYVIVHKPYLNISEDNGFQKAHIYKKFYEEAAGILTMTNYVKELIKLFYNIDESKFVFLPHPNYETLLSRYGQTDLSNNFKDWEKGLPVISFISRMYEEHGFDNLCEALPILNKLLPDYLLLLVAPCKDSVLRNKIELKLKKIGLKNRYKWHWNYYLFSELNYYLSLTTVIVTPYNFATQSGPIAIAAGKFIPVVATSVGGLREWVSPGVNGELVPLHDPELMAKNIVKVVRNIDTYRIKGRHFYEENFSPQKSVQAIVNSLMNET